MTKELSILEVTEEGELIEFEGQSIVVDASGLPLRFEKGFLCGECKRRHCSIKAIKLCHLVSAEHKENALADYLHEQYAERYYENRGADEALAQDEYEARNGVIGFREAWHRESPETCPCCNS